MLKLKKKKSNTQKQTRTLTEAETRTLGWNGEVGKMGKCWSKNTKWQLCKMSTTRESIYSMMTVINNIVLNTGNFLRQYISDARIKNKIKRW